MTAIADQGTIDASHISGTLVAQAGQGEIDVTGLTGRLTADAGRGDIVLSGITGSLTAQVAQGAITALARQSARHAQQRPEHHQRHVHPATRAGGRKLPARVSNPAAARRSVL